MISFVKTIEEYLSCKTDMPAEIFYAEKAKRLPKYMYKYRSYNENAIDNVKANTVWLASPRDYNDPNDSLFLLSMREVFESVIRESKSRSFLKNILRNYFSATEMDAAFDSDNFMMAIIELGVKKYSNNYDPALQELISVFAEISADRFEKVTFDYNNAVSSSIKVCSFSETKDSSSMWEHYADNFSGFVIEFDLSTTSIMDYQNRFMFPIIYVSNIPDLTKSILPATNCPRASMYASIHKLDCYLFEKEYRLVFPFGFIAANENFPMAPISGIYFGKNMNHEQTDELISIARSKGIPLYSQEHRIATGNFHYNRKI